VEAMKPKIYLVENNEHFKQANLENWRENSDFWLEGKMRHLKDVAAFTTAELARLLAFTYRKNHLPALFDFGCGDGWIYRLIHDSHLDARYVGIDYNERFIDELRLKYTDTDLGKFYCFDLESPPPNELLAMADVGLNFFNLFELPDVAAGIKNMAAMLRPGGRLLIVSIDPVMQILAVSQDQNNFLKNLKLYEQRGERVGYDKDIDVGDTPSGRIYRSLLYSTATYVRLGKAAGLEIEDYKEIVKTANSVPQIYQFIFFKKT
jgi:SAM-dependent methyltransferase